MWVGRKDKKGRWSFLPFLVIQLRYILSSLWIWYSVKVEESRSNVLLDLRIEVAKHLEHSLSEDYHSIFWMISLSNLCRATSEIWKGYFQLVTVPIFLNFFLIFHSSYSNSSPLISTHSNSGKGGRYWRLCPKRFADCDNRFSSKYCWCVCQLCKIQLQNM